MPSTPRESLPETGNARILVVCRDSAAGQVLADRLTRLGHAVCAVARPGPRAFELVVEQRPDLALIDVEQEAGVIQAAGFIGQRFDVPLVYLVGDPGETLLERIRQTAPAGYVTKPLNEQQLRLSIEAALCQSAAWRRGSEGHGEHHATAFDLRQQIHFLRATLDSMTEGVVVADADGDIRFVNRAIRDLFGTGGQKLGNLAQASGEYLILKSDEHTPVPPSEFPLRLAMQGELTGNTELFVRRRDGPAGSGRHLAVSGSPLLDASGRRRGGIAVLRDITRQKKSEVKLARTLRTTREQTEILDRVLGNMSDGIAVFDADGRCVLLNAEARRLAGIGAADAGVNRITSVDAEIRHADGSPCPPTERPFARALRGESFDDLHLLVSTPQATSPHHVFCSGRPLLDEDGQRRGGITIFRDVSEERRRQEQLEETERELRRVNEDLQQQNRFREMILDGISDGVAVADLSGRLTFVNRSLRRLLPDLGVTGAPPDEWGAIYGLFRTDAVTPMPTEELPLVRAIRGEASNDVEVFVRNRDIPDGMYTSVSGRPIRNASGVPVGGGVKC